MIRPIKIFLYFVLTASLIILINKALIEIPPKFKDMEPIHPGLKERNHYRNAEGGGVEFPPYWHTQRDDIGVIGPSVMDDVGGVLAELIYNRVR